MFEGLKETVEELIPAADRVKEAYEQGGIEGALEQVADEWDKIYEDRLKPLWEDTFLPFLENTVKPALVGIGTEIGTAVAEAIKQSILDSLDPALNPAWLRRLENMLLFTDPPAPPPPPPGRPGGGGGPGGDRRPSPGGGDRSSFDPPPFPPTPPIPGPEPIPLPQPGRPTPGLGGVRFFAEGGIVTGPTLGVVGEAGPEAIIPLDRGMGGQTVVNVTVTSADPQAVVEAIRRYTRNNGPLSQVVSV